MNVNENDLCQCDHRRRAHAHYRGEHPSACVIPDCQCSKFVHSGRTLMIQLQEMYTDFDCPNPHCRAASMTELLHEWNDDYDVWRCPYCYTKMFAEARR